MSKLIVPYFRFKALFSSYSAICLPWRLLWKIPSWADQPLHSGLIFQLDRHIYATGQAATQVKTQKRNCWRLATIPASILFSRGWRCGSMVSPHADCTTNSSVYSAKFLLIAAAQAHCLYLLSVSRAHIAAIPQRHQYFSAFHFFCHHIPCQQRLRLGNWTENLPECCSYKMKTL